MQNLRKYTPFLLSALLMWVVLYFIYPHYQYYIDPDGTAYLTISKRYAAGDFAKAINGYWSPWSCWLTALLIRAGMEAIPASVVINALGATGFLFISQSLFLRFSIATTLQWLLNATLALFLCYAVFWQSFDDLWECFFLLSALRLMLAEGFGNKISYWTAYGAIGALAYFAKAYSFPFFILSTVCCGWFAIDDRKARWRMYAVALGVLALCAAPWILALHHKYGIWTTSTAGALNTSWYLVGHPYWKAGIDILIPPTYPDSPYYWEDPYMANGITPYLWDSMLLFGRQLAKIAYNGWKFLVSTFQLSFLFPVIVIMVAMHCYRYIQNNSTTTPVSKHYFIAGLSLLLFPLGYFLVNFEARYLWYMLPIGMVAGSLHLQQMKQGIMRSMLLLIVPVSLLIYPTIGLIKMHDVGKRDHQIAEQLKHLNIHGSFACMAQPGADAQSIERIAYFSGCPLYSMPVPDIKKDAIFRELRRYRIKYYFYYVRQPEKLVEIFDPQVYDENGHPLPEVTGGAIDGLRVFLVTP